jgi:hypothetical protein
MNRFFVTPEARSFDRSLQNLPVFRLESFVRRLALQPWWLWTEVLCDQIFEDANRWLRPRGIHDPKIAATNLGVAN